MKDNAPGVARAVEVGDCHLWIRNGAGSADGWLEVTRDAAVAVEARAKSAARLIGERATDAEGLLEDFLAAAPEFLHVHAVGQR